VVDALSNCDGGMPLHEVSAMLGRSSIEQTSTYLNVQKGGMQKSMRALDDRRELQEIASQSIEEHGPTCNVAEALDAKVVVN
jgi:hypothetical protein